jgi:hypothetical protein
MTNDKSFDVLDYEQSNIKHRHGCFQKNGSLMNNVGGTI